MANKRTFVSSGALHKSKVLILQTQGEFDPNATANVRLVVTTSHPRGGALVEQIIEENRAALDALAKETRRLEKS